MKKRKNNRGILTGKHILIGMTGSIACYKAVELISKLKKEKADINVIMTNNATKFISPLTLQTISGSQVYYDMFSSVKNFDCLHIGLSKKADILCIVPATANFIAKLAYGFADDLLTTVALDCKCPILIAPAMHKHMFENIVTKKNISILKERGVHFIGPVVGTLSSGEEGIGRLINIEQIIIKIKSILKKKI